MTLDSLLTDQEKHELINLGALLTVIAAAYLIVNGRKIMETGISIGQRVYKFYQRFKTPSTAINSDPLPLSQGVYQERVNARVEFYHEQLQERMKAAEEQNKQRYARVHVP